MQNKPRILEFESLAHRKYNLDPKSDVGKKYEAYINELRKGYEQQKLELEPLILKVDLLETERKQLLEEIQQYKLSQTEILKNFEQESQERDKLRRINQRQQEQIQLLQRMQMPKEYQTKKCLELQESLNAALSEVIHDFVQQYENYLTQDDKDYDQLVDGLLKQIEETVAMFVENLPPQSSRNNQSEEITHYKDKIEEICKQLQIAQMEVGDLQAALESEKIHSQKLQSQRNTAQELNQQFQAQIEQLKLEVKLLQEEHSVAEKKARDLDNILKLLRENSLNETEKLKNEFIETIAQLQSELKKFQSENSLLKDRLSQVDQLTQSSYEENLKITRELETKLQKEINKLDLKQRECSRLEKELKEAKQELGKLFEDKNVFAQQLEILKDKRKQDKENFESLNERYKKSKQKLNQLEQELGERTRQFESELQQWKGKAESGEEKKDECIDKELTISKQEQVIQELMAKVNEQTGSIVNLKIELEGKKKDLEKLNRDLANMKDRQNFARTEITHLTQRKELMERELKDMKAQLQMTQMQIQGGESRGSPGKQQLDLNMSMTSNRSDKSNKSKSSKSSIFNFFRSPAPIAPPPIMVNPDRKIAEKVIQEQTEKLKRDLEELYKKYIMPMIQRAEGPNDDVMQLFRQIHDCVKQTHDLSDNIEDFLIS